MSSGIWSVSRDWLLYLDDLIACTKKIGRLTAGRDAVALRGDEAAFDLVLFKLLVIGESFKQLPEDQLLQLPEAHGR